MSAAPELRFNVPDMDCGHCVHAITQAIHRVDPAAEVRADLAAQQVSVSGAAAQSTYAAAIEAAGFSAAPG